MKKKIPLKSVFVACDPPIPPTGGSTRTLHFLNSVLTVSACDLFILFPSARKKIPLNILESCASIDISKIQFSSDQGSKWQNFIQKLRILFFPRSFHDVELVRLADYYANNPFGGKRFLKKVFYNFQRRSIVLAGKRLYKRGYDYPARTLERLGQYNELEAHILEKLKGADFLWIDFSYSLPFFSHVKRSHKDLKIICNAHNIEYKYLERMVFIATDRIQRSWLTLQATVMKAIELKGYADCDLVLVCSEEDRKILEKELSTVIKVETVYNGVDMSYFTPLAPETQVPTLLFTGTMSYAPNKDAVHYFVHHILPFVKKNEGNCKFLIAGANASYVFPEYLESKDIEVISSPEDIRPLYKRANVVVVPLRAGSGTRLKILEAIAMKRAVVSTGLGAEGLLLESGKDLLIADTDELFAKHILRLLRNPEAAIAQVNSAYNKVEGLYNWPKIELYLSRLLVKFFNRNIN